MQATTEANAALELSSTAGTATDGDRAVLARTTKCRIPDSAGCARSLRVVSDLYRLSGLTLAFWGVFLED